MHVAIPHIMLTPRAILLGIVVGASTGAFTALVVDRILRRGKPNLLVDAILGAIGYVGGALALAMLPVMRRTTSYTAGNMVIRTTSWHYQDAYRLAFGVAVLLAVLYELFYYLRNRSRPKQVEPASQTP